MTTALEGAVIVKETETVVYYHPKCESCGNVNTMHTDTTGTVTGGESATSFRCQNCGNIQRVLFRP